MLTDLQRRAMFAKQVYTRKKKRPIRRNHGKRAITGSHGFKVHKYTSIYVGKATTRKAGVPLILHNKVIKMWNTEPDIVKLKKHIKIISVRYLTSGNIAGLWDDKTHKFTLNVRDGTTVANVEEVVFHEVIGHAYWQWSQQWRRNDLIAFNRLAIRVTPVNDYVLEYENGGKGGNRNDEIGSRSNDRGHDTMTRYANEQHSAITELMKHGSSYHKLIGDPKDIQALKRLWSKLHY